MAVAKSSSQSAKRVKELLEQSECPRALLLLSPDRVRRERITKLFFSKFIPADASNAVTSFDANNLNEKSLRALRDDFSSLSLFSRIRFFLIRNVETLSAKATDELLKILQIASPQAPLVLHGTKLASNSRLLKALSREGLAIVFEEAQAGELRRWITKELKAQGVTEAPQSVVDLICRLAMEEQGEPAFDAAAKVVEQLALYLGQEPATDEAFYELFDLTVDLNEFELIDALSAGDIRKVERLGTKLTKTGKNPFAFLGLLSKTYSSYLVIRSLLDQGIPLREVRRSAKMKPWLFDKYLTGAKCYSQEELHHNIEALVRADSRLKGRSLATENIFGMLLSECVSSR
ncbi:MAG: DNA polymerase III subunit delta [Bdellovibrionales bacterium]|nr:DNA polymerase III subunit delta [Bdellovibrionales bacterium]